MRKKRMKWLLASIAVMAMGMAAATALAAEPGNPAEGEETEAAGSSDTEDETPEIITVTFNAKGGEFENTGLQAEQDQDGNWVVNVACAVPESGNLTFGEFTGQLGTVKREGYQLAAWKMDMTEPIAQTIELKAGTSVSGGMEVYASWEADEPSTELKPPAETEKQPPAEPETQPETQPQKQTEPAGTVNQPAQQPGEIEGMTVKRKKKNASNVDISWKVAEKAACYLVTCSTKKNSGYKVLKTELMRGEQAFKVTAENLKPGRKYYFRVTAYSDYTAENVVSTKTVSYQAKPNKPKIKLKKVQGLYQIYWGAVEKGVAGIEIQKNKKSLAASTVTKYKYYNISPQNAPKGTKFRVRVYFKDGKKKVYSSWSNVLKVK